MKTCVALQVAVLLLGLTRLSLATLPEGASDPKSETPSPEIVPPSNDDSSAVSPEETSESEPDSTAPEIGSPPDADSFDMSSGENNEPESEAEPPSPAAEAFQSALDHDKKNEVKEAIADCTEAIRLDPKNFEYLIARADLYSETGEYEKSLADRQKATQFQPL